MDILAKLQELASGGHAAALCTIIETSGSTPRKPGTKMIVTAEGKNIGSVGGGLLEQYVIRDAMDLIAGGKARLMEYHSGGDGEDRSYGEAKVFIDPLPRSKSLSIFGAGHVGQALASLAGKYGFRICLIDHRDTLLDAIITEGITKKHSEYLKAVEELEFGPDTYVLVSTYSHASDEATTLACAAKPHAYLGMIGSKKKVEQARKMFRENGLPEEAIEGIDMPVGVPIRCETPEEIAISILAKLIDTKNA